MARDSRSPFKDRAQPRRTAKSPYRGLRTLYIFDSPRNQKRFEVLGQCCFAHCILAEGDPNVRRYLPSKPPQERGEKPYRQTVSVEFYEGRRELWVFERAVKSADDGADEAKLVVKTDEEIRRSGWLLMNWMGLCADRNRVRGCSTFLELGTLMRALDLSAHLTVQQAVSIDGVDPALMLAAIAAELAEGRLRSELNTAPYCLTSDLWRP